MKRLICLALAFFSISTGTANADGVTGTGSVGDQGTTVGVIVAGPGSATPGSPSDPSQPLVHYLVSYHVVDPVGGTAGDQDGLCAAPGSTATAPIFGWAFHLVGTDATGKIVDDRLICVPFTPGETTRPTAPPLPAVPTFGEAWNSVQLPAPAVTLDPSDHGITGLETRIATAGPATVVIAATIRGYTITGVATVDHYSISVDGQAATDSDSGRYTFETKGNHTIAISAIWHGVATVTGGALAAPLQTIDLGSATITSTRAYRVDEIRSVLQP